MNDLIFSIDLINFYIYMSFRIILSKHNLFDPRYKIKTITTFNNKNENKFIRTHAENKNIKYGIDKRQKNVKIRTRKNSKSTASC